jgi:hypothetical protein
MGTTGCAEIIALSGGMFLPAAGKKQFLGATKPHSTSDEGLLKPALLTPAITGSDKLIEPKWLK